MGAHTCIHTSLHVPIWGFIFLLLFSNICKKIPCRDWNQTCITCWHFLCRILAQNIVKWSNSSILTFNASSLLITALQVSCVSVTDGMSGHCSARPCLVREIFWIWVMTNVASSDGSISSLRPHQTPGAAAACNGDSRQVFIKLPVLKKKRKNRRSHDSSFSSLSIYSFEGYPF